MTKPFGSDTALLSIDVQYGVDDLQHWGGPRGRRNNPQAEENIARLLDAWRRRSFPVFHTQHDSTEPNSPLRLSLPGGRIKEQAAPIQGETVIVKDVHSAFIGTRLSLYLRRLDVRRLVCIGFFTNMCVATTVRMSQNLGFDTYCISDATSCTNRTARDGTDYDPELVHDITLATLHREFCTVLTTEEALELVVGDH